MIHIPERTRHETRAATLSLLLGIALLAVKFIAYLLTNSAAIFSDALESIVNVLASSLALYAIILAHRPADADHPYGHGKVEFMSAGIEGGMMLVASGVIVLRAVEQLIEGAQIEQARLGDAALLLIGATTVNAALGVYLLRAGKRGGSITLEADGKHLLADAVTSVGVLVSLWLVKLTGWKRLDPLVALAMGVFVARQALGLLRRSAAGLMDEQDRQDDKLLRQILDSHVSLDGKEPRICSYHKLRHRHSGRYHWVDFHIMVPRDWDIDRAHRVASAIEYEIENALVEANATAHVEPCIDEGCDTCTGEQED